MNFDRCLRFLLLTLGCSSMLLGCEMVDVPVAQASDDDDTATPGDDDDTATPGDDDDSTPPGDDDDSTPPGDDDDSTPPGDDDDTVAADCLAGEVPDCAGSCVPSAYLGDNACDDGSYEYPEGSGIPVFLNCSTFANDAGDCGLVECPEVGLIPDCTGVTWCASATLLGNQICDDTNSETSIDFNCEQLNFDAGDCQGLGD
tara:strand:- start:682 stop:1284 length:603 start_codon:yes stop_codon:yes gene_type:complete